MNDNFFSDENIPSSNWFTFDTVGQVVKGTLVEKFLKQPEGNFPAQTVYVLTNASVGDAEIVDEKPTNPKMQEVGDINVGISKDFINSRLRGTVEGDIIGFAFIKEIPPKTKGFNPAKSILPFVGGVDRKYLDSKLTSEAEDIFQ